MPRSRTLQRQSLACAALAAGLLVLGTALAPAPASAVTVSFDPLHGYFVNNDTLTVDVTVDAVADLRGFTFVFEFNPTIVRPVTVKAGPLVTGAACPNFFTWINSGAIGDSIDVDAALLGCSVAGPGRIIRTRWVGVSPGISPLRCRANRGAMRNSNNTPIPFSCDDGTIQYERPVEVEPIHWSRAKGLYR